MINHVTSKERANSEIISGSRRRIAAGSGTSVQDVNQLLKQYTQMRKMFKGLGSGGGKMQRRLLSQMGQMGRRRLRAVSVVRLKRFRQPKTVTLDKLASPVQSVMYQPGAGSFRKPDFRGTSSV